MFQEQEKEDKPKGNDTETKDAKGNDDDRSSRGPLDRPDRGFDHALGGDRYAREFQAMSDRVNQMAREAGIDLPNRGENDQKHEKGADYHLIDDFTTKSDLHFSLGAKIGDLSAQTEYVGLMIVALRHGFVVTGSNEKKDHNPRSLHYIGRAVDVRIRDKTDEEVQEFTHDARMEGIDVRNERTQPAGQQVWRGQHLHLSVPEHWHQSNDNIPHSRDQLPMRSGNQGGTMWP